MGRPKNKKEGECAFCGKKLVLNRKNKLFCSDSCRVKSHLRKKQLQTETTINELKERLRKYEEG
jgi:hypothetical protein